MSDQRRIENDLLLFAHKSFYGNAWKQRPNMLFRSQPTSKVQDEIFSNDDRMERYSFAIAEKFEATYSRCSLNPSGLLGASSNSYYPGDIGRILFVSGYSMEPGGIPPHTEDLSVSEDVLAAITEVSSLVCSDWEACTVKLNKISSSGLPLMTKSIIKKRQLQFTAKSEFIHMVRAFNDRDVEAVRSLYWNHQIPYVYAMGSRNSVQNVEIKDGKCVTKERRITTFDDTIVSANFNLSFSERLAMRRRIVYSPSGGINYPLQFLAAGIRKSLGVKYPITFKPRGPADIEAKAARFRFFIPLDFVAFDQSIASGCFRAMVNEFPFTDEVKEFITNVPHLPLLIRSDWSADVNEDVRMRYRGNVEKPWLEPNHIGNPSGWPFVDITAKVVAISVIWALVKPLLTSTLHEILSGASIEFGIQNMGDDCLLMLNDENLYNHLVSVFDGKLESSAKLAPFKIEIERPGCFCGWHLIQDKPDDSLKLMRRFSSFFESRYARERGIDHPSVAYPAIGFNASRDLHLTHHNGISSYELADRLFKKHFGYTHGDIVGLDETVKGLESLSLADYEVLSDPSKLQWKFDDSEVNSTLLNQFYHVTPANEVEQWTKQFLI